MLNSVINSLNGNFVFIYLLVVGSSAILGLKGRRLIQEVIEEKPSIIVCVGTVYLLMAALCLFFYWKGSTIFMENGIQLISNGWLLTLIWVVILGLNGLFQLNYEFLSSKPKKIKYNLLGFFLWVFYFIFEFGVTIVSFDTLTYFRL